MKRAAKASKEAAQSGDVQVGIFSVCPFSKDGGVRGISLWEARWL